MTREELEELRRIRQEIERLTKMLGQFVDALSEAGPNALPALRGLHSVNENDDDD